MKKFTSFASVLLLAGLFSSTAQAQYAQPPAPAPDTWILFGSDVFANGQSSNFGPAFNQTIGEFWTRGDCPYTVFGTDYYDNCDLLRFGFAAHARGQRATTMCFEDARIYGPPEEDGGRAIANYINNVQVDRNANYVCENDEFRNHDTGLYHLWETTFPQLDLNPNFVSEFWNRPHLALLIIGELPQLSDLDHDDRIIKTVDQVCEMYKPTSPKIPSMPTWVLVDRQITHEAVPFAAITSAAGGTGECCFTDGTIATCDDEGNNACDPGFQCVGAVSGRRNSGVCLCDPTDPDQVIDICTHVHEVGRTEATLRTELAEGRYACGGGAQKFSTGSMAYEDGNNALPQIRCHLDNSAPGCDPDDTDLFGMFSCVRQLPYGVTADDAIVRWCPPWVDPDNDINEECEFLTEDNGDIEFIDENRTLFVITRTEKCDASDLEVFECPWYDPCETGLPGRCADGQIDCSDNTIKCVPLTPKMPEICNGLDDDCNGVVDNLETGWDDPDFSGWTLPTEYEGVDCNRDDTVCSCPSGDTDSHIGTNFEEYLAGWSGVCACGENLSPDLTPAPAEEPAAENQAACSAVSSGDTIPLSFIGLLVVGMVGGVRRRLRRR